MQAPASGLFSFPHKIQLQTIDLCNYHCPMCPYPALADGKPKTRLDRALYARLIADVRRSGRRVRLCLMLQNEPLLDRRFLELVDEAHAAEDAIQSISTVTNGSTLRPDDLDHLAARERLHLTISVNANDPQRYREIHGVDLWPRIDALLSGWRGARDRVRLSFVMDAQSIDEAKRFVATWTERGYQTRLVPIMARAGTLPLPIGRRPVVDDFDHCHYPVDTLNVLADGTVILCCNDWVHQQTFGNLHERSIEEIWNGPELSRIRAAAIEGRIRDASPTCRGCDYPMRSSVRMQLEDLCGDAGLGETPFAFVTHATELRLTGPGATLGVVVYDVDETRGSVACAADANDPAVQALARDHDADAELCIRIAQGDRFSFGSLEPVWCAGTVRIIQDASGASELALLRVTLSPAADAYPLLRWYAADWRTPTPRSTPSSRAGDPDATRASRG